MANASAWPIAAATSAFDPPSTAQAAASWARMPAQRAAKGTRSSASTGLVGASFSAPAVDLAQQHNVSLIDGSALLALLGLAGQPLPGQTAAPAFVAPPPSHVPATPVVTAPRAVAALRCPSCGIVQANAGMPFCAECGMRLNR